MCVCVAPVRRCVCAPGWTGQACSYPVVNISDATTGSTTGGTTGQTTTGALIDVRNLTIPPRTWVYMWAKVSTPALSRSLSLSLSLTHTHTHTHRVSQTTKQHARALAIPSPHAKTHAPTDQQARSSCVYMRVYSCVCHAAPPHASCHPSFVG